MYANATVSAPTIRRDGVSRSNRARGASAAATATASVSPSNAWTRLGPTSETATATACGPRG